MLDLLSKGVGAGASQQPQYGAQPQKDGRAVAEGELRKRHVAVGVGMGCEWWDNNGGGNYKIGFREREIVVGRSRAQLQQLEGILNGTVAPMMGQGELLLDKLGVDNAQALARRKSAVSCPRTSSFPFAPFHFIVFIYGG